MGSSDYLLIIDDAAIDAEIQAMQDNPTPGWEDRLRDVVRESVRFALPIGSKIVVPDFD